MQLERKVRVLTGATFWSLHADAELGIPRLVLSDGPAGVRGERWDEREPSANVPSPTALAATWDEERVRRIGSLLAAEAVAKGVHVLLAPTVNLHRSPYGGRHFECFSEDPLLTARLAVAYVQGVQAGGVAATVKHFVANDSETERFTLDARVDERALRELYLAPFEAAVAAGAWAVMAAYNAVNGVAMTEHPMLEDVLRGEWGFDGVVMSDWFAARRTVETACASLDLVMPGPDGPWGGALVAAVRDGRVSEAAVDAKVARLRRLAQRTAAPKPEPWPAQRVAAELRSCAAAACVLLRNEDEALPLRGVRRVAVVGPGAAQARTMGGGSATVFPPYAVSPLEGLRAAGLDVVHAAGARASARLAGAALRDVRLRYLAADGRELASEARAASRFTWTGEFVPGLAVEDVAVVELHARLPEDARLVGCSGVGRFQACVDGREVFDVRLALPQGADPVEAMMAPPQHAVEVSGSRLVLRARETTAFEVVAEPPWPDAALARAVALAADADAAVVVVGTTPEVESEGFDRATLSLPGDQDELVRRVAAVNPRTVVVVNAGAPVLLPWRFDVPAIVVAWFGGQELGNGLADVLLGLAEPGGRLPTVWPDAEGGPSVVPADGVLRYQESLAVGHRSGAVGAFAFGHGLGYTDWVYESLTVEGRRAVVRVRNAGARAGREVVQAYLSRPDSAVARPVRWLAGFAIVAAEPGEVVSAVVDVPERAFQHWEDGGWRREPGPFSVAVGRSSADLRLRGEFPSPRA